MRILTTPMLPAVALLALICLCGSRSGLWASDSLAPIPMQVRLADEAGTQANAVPAGLTASPDHGATAAVPKVIGTQRTVAAANPDEPTPLASAEADQARATLSPASLAKVTVRGGQLKVEKDSHLVYETSLVCPVAAG
jgi:hypothetical protein